MPDATVIDDFILRLYGEATRRIVGYLGTRHIPSLSEGAVLAIANSIAAPQCHGDFLSLSGFKHGMMAASLPFESASFLPKGVAP
jgi:hypothetical protein